MNYHRGLQIITWSIHIKKKGVLARGQNTTKVWITELNGGQLVWAIISTPFATIHNYNNRLSGFARETREAIQSRSCNPFNSTEPRVQCFQQYGITLA